MHMVSTYFNIEDVEKNAYPTWKQTPNQTLKAECKLLLKPSCGTVEISTSQKEKILHKKGLRKLVIVMVR
jgi:hypothetical protein